MKSHVYTTDTSTEAEAVQLDLLRQMTAQQRFDKMCRLSKSVREMAFAAIRRNHPEFSENETRLKFIAVTYGQSLSDEIRQWQEERGHE